MYVASSDARCFLRDLGLRVAWTPEYAISAEDSDMSSNRLKIGVHKGAGPAPGYQWHILIVDFAYDEAMKFLDAAQYAHLAEQFQELARQDDPSRSLVVSVDAIEDFHELRDKGGVLGSKNVRVFYYVDKRNRSIVVVGATLKQNNGPTPQTVKVRIRRRVRDYMNGSYGDLFAASEAVAAERQEREGSGP
jgi:ABC-type transport system substrate-binding protein